jgi:hypothetical protein
MPLYARAVGATDLRGISAAIHDQYFDVGAIERDQQADVVRVRILPGEWRKMGRTPGLRP